MERRFIGQNHICKKTCEIWAKLRIVVEHDPNLINSKIRTTIRRINITDETGKQYVFEDMELSEVIKYNTIEYYYNGSLQSSKTLSSGCSYPTNGAASSLPGSCSDLAYPVTRGMQTGEFVCNKWMLTKIINPLTNKTITFNYDNVPLVIDGASHASQSSLASNACSFSISMDKKSGTFKRIRNIYNQFGDKIEFNYEQNREDLPGDQALKNISYYNNSALISKTVFQYAYFCKQSIRNITDNFDFREKAFLRLCLQQFQKIGLNNVKEQPYKFEYTLNMTSGTSIFPPRFCLFKDDWGYFNAGGSSSYAFDDIPEAGKPYSLFIYQNSFNPSAFHAIPNDNILYSANGLIKSVTYPLGGQLIFDYEQNKAFYQNNNIIVGGARVSKINLNDGVTSRQYQYKYILENQVNSSGIVYNVPTYTDALPIQVNKCDNGIRFPVTDAISTTSALIKGNLIGFAVQALIPVLFDIFTNNQLQNLTVTYTYSDPVNLNNQLPFIYSRVETKNITNNIVSGTDISEFTSFNEYAPEIPVLSSPFSERQRYAYWKYGLPRTLINRDANGNTLKKIEYLYSPPSQQTITDNIYASQKWKVSKMMYGCAYTHNDDINLNISDRISSETYYPFTGKIDLAQTKEYLYNSAGDYTLKTTLFEYNTDYLLSLKTENNSKGEKIETVYKYANNYALAGPITTLKANNNISAPVSTETYIYKSGIKKLLSGSVIEYGTLQNGNIQPITTYSLITDRPVNDNSLTAFSSTQLVRDPNYYKPASQLIYDANGNLVQTNKLFNNITTIPEKSSVVVDISNPQLVIATATNCSYPDIAYTSFEAIGSGDNWSYNESLLFRDDWLTGNTSIKFDNIVRSVSKTNMSSAVKYKISFWAKNIGSANFIPLVNKNNDRVNGYLANNITPTKVYTNPVTQWSLYECYVTGATSVYIHNQDPANTANGVPVLIDEVKLYPEGAAMSTATYNIQGLKTSVTDANNKVQFMEYDGLGRLRLIRDEERNVIKTYEYNFKQ